MRVRLIALAVIAVILAVIGWLVTRFWLIFFLMLIIALANSEPNARFNP